MTKKENTYLINKNNLKFIQEGTMKGKIIKTSIITVIAVLAVYLIAWGATCLFYPYALAKMHAKLNDYDNACKYYELDYKRNPSLSKLENLTGYCYLAKEHEKVVKYGEKLVSNEEFLEQGEYIDVTCFIVVSKYALEHEDTVEKAFDYAVVVEDEKIVELNEECISILTLKAYEGEDMSTLESILREWQKVDPDLAPGDDFYDFINLKITEVQNAIAGLTE